MTSLGRELVERSRSVIADENRYAKPERVDFPQNARLDVCQKIQNPLERPQTANNHRTRIREDYTLIDFIEKFRSIEPR